MDVLSHLDFKKTSEVRNVLLHKLAAAPESPVEGQVYYNTATHLAEVWNGTSWEPWGADHLTAGDGLTRTGDDFDVNVGAGIEISADALRIAAAAAGNGLTGGGGSALAVNVGAGIEISSDAVRIAAAAAGAGLTGGAGSALAVGAGTGIVANANDVAVDTATIATRAYVDSVAQGLDIKASVRAATTANIDRINNLVNGQTLDGVTLATGNRVLVKNQTDPKENGIFEVVAVAPPEPVRTTDANEAGELSGGTFVFVEEGTVNADTGWVITTNGSITPGTTSHAWAQFSTAAELVAGDALTKTGNTLDVKPGAGLEISSDTIRIAAAAAGNGLTGGAGSALAVGAGTGIVSNANDVAVDTGTIATKAFVEGRTFSVDVGDGGSTEITITHNLGSEDVDVTVRRDSGGLSDAVIVDWETDGANKVILHFLVAPGVAEFRAKVSR